MQAIPQDLNGYLREFADQLGDRILAQFPPLFQPGKAVLPAVNELRRKPFPAQELAIMGIVNRWDEARAAAAIAECGTGKTLISLGAVHANAGGQRHTTLAMVPRN